MHPEMLFQTSIHLLFELRGENKRKGPVSGVTPHAKPSAMALVIFCVSLKSPLLRTYLVGTRLLADIW